MRKTGLDECRLVTVTGPGGVGKTRLAAEVAERVAGRFADGVWLVELATVLDPAQVPAATAAVLGVREQPGVAVTDSLAEMLGRQQMLLVLDSCEHMAGAAAEMCAALLQVADDVRILATSREPLGVAGEARYRLPPLTLPAPDDPAGIPGSEAVALFADRARRADRQFTLSADSAPAVAQLVTKLDGMPLAIELAAARVEALGLSQLLDRLDDRFVLLARTDREPAAARHRSLAATADWSYQLLSEPDRRRVSVFPAPFTLEAAEAVAGEDAGPAVLRLVDCSLLAPPRVGPDSRSRYLMLETLRGYGLDRLQDAGELQQARASMARYAVAMVDQALAGMQGTSGELAAARWLDAEEAIARHALGWALDYEPAAALRLAVGLAPWWRLRGRTVDGEPLLRAAMEHAEPGDGEWCAGHYRLGLMAMTAGDFTTALDHFTAVPDAEADRGPSPVLADCLTGCCVALANLGRTAEAVENGQRALAVARQLRYLAGEALALTNLAITTYYVGEISDALSWARQAQHIDRESIPGGIARVCDNILVLVLIAAGEFSAAERSCFEALDGCREAGDLQTQAALLTLLGHLDLDAGRLIDAAAHLQESLQVSLRIGDQTELLNCVDNCGHLCAATGRWADAITLWAALAAYTEQAGLPDPQDDALRRQEPQREAARMLGPARTREAEHRGAAMTLAIAAEFAVMLTSADAAAPQAQPQAAQLTRRERELVRLVAQGCTDAQIAGQLSISIRTVRSHLDRIRNKTGSRRRADLTRLALQADLV